MLRMRREPVLPLRSDARQLMRFFHVGLIALAFDYTIMVTAVEILGCDPVSASLAGYISGGVLSYMLNARWTFGKPAQDSMQALRFFIVAGLGFSGTWALMNLLTAVLALPYGPSRLFTTGLIFGANFVLHKLWSFR